MSSNGELSERQERAIVCLLECPTIEEASKKAGVARSTLYKWMKVPTFRRILNCAKREQFQAAIVQMQSLVPEAIKGLKELAHSSNEQIRIRACVEILKTTKAYGSSRLPPISLEDSIKGIPINLV